MGAMYRGEISEWVCWTWDINHCRDDNGTVVRPGAVVEGVAGVVGAVVVGGVVIRTGGYWH